MTDQLNHNSRKWPAASKRTVQTLLGSTSFAAMLSMGLAMPASAQDSADSEEMAFEEIVVTGIRKSLQESMDIKRDARGIVDGIVAEDMGKFPDSNLAESLQRITGVAINRQAGEGSQVTVRGFGPGFNQITLNGRSMPSADIPIVGGSGAGLLGQASDRAFDLSNLASESVRALQVYKSGRADIASGGVGATINIETRKPLETEGFTGTIIAKAAHDSGVDIYNDVTPDLTGMMSWSNEGGTFGISLFGGYSRRDSGSGTLSVAGWDIFTADQFLDPSNGMVNSSTQVNNLPSDGSQLVAIARDSRFRVTDITRERINGQAVVQFNPTDRIRMTADVLYAETEAAEQRADISNWFSRPFSQVTFDDNPTVATAEFMAETIGGAKDYALQQSYRATKDKLESFGVNIEYDAMDNLTLKLDAHSSKASVTPNARTGYAETNVGMAMPIVTAQSLDFSSGTPVIGITRDDSINSNGDGVYDVNDISTQIANDLRYIHQINKVDQVDFRAEWDLDDSIALTFGANYREQSNETSEALYRQTMGNWGASNPGDVEDLAPGALEQFDLSGRYNDFPVQDGLVGFRGNALDIWEATSPFYAAQGNAIGLLQSNFDIVEEQVISVYAQFDGEFELAERPVRISAGLRYEQTDVTSFTQSAPTTDIVWEGDNDFARVAGSATAGFTQDASYDNFLPNLDIAVDLTDNFVSRFSYSKTLSRSSYDNLNASISVNQPPGPSALGNPLTGSAGTPGLLPLVSENFDLSFEWYYGDDDFISVGAFHKNVKNFVGQRTVVEDLGIRDVTSGAAGTRSGQALDALGAMGVDATNQTLFAMTALIDQLGSVSAATTEFQANYSNGVLDNDFYVGLETDFDVVADGNDPNWDVNVTRPLNIEEASIRGLEIAAQHFFGDTGFGVAASYTLVDGDIGFDVGADPSDDQFALVGLSDTANVTLIYENYGFSARLAYNWRDEFLSSANRGDAFNNPTFTEAFSTFDLNVSYDVTEDIAVSFEAINITGEDSREYNRATNQLWFARENAPRYYLGVRYKF
ncbi:MULTISPECIES: TonB-dependent receptor [Kordiimonas]|jgi:TonB-dependent receptor|uniref:TonB-dependent receptor n=1 Tax=Kordiimonas lacus TaxID=637679 RepID=A0A1G6SY67_9PROT|nr:MULTISPECIES: TonB-dependent receptor [Kordiimonas]SDD21025.1 TonB-dependent receptor [Kordiimonas lacus]